MTVRRNNYLLVIMLFLSAVTWAQNDTIQLKNKDILVGEVKLISKGILTIETAYSDEDFKVEFNKVSELIIQRKCLIVLTEGRRRFGNIRTDSPGKFLITLEDGSVEHFNLEEIIILEEIDAHFWSRFKVSIDLGLNITKANNDTQFTIGGELNYIDPFWLFDGNINVLNSKQDHADKTKRTDANLELIRILPRKWYLMGDVSLLSNTEQALDSRISPSLGVGKFLLSTNKLYLGLSLGLAYNIENYVDASLDKTSSEAFISVFFDMFDFEDIDLETGIKFYSSLSEKERNRADYDITLKYDLPSDFYIKLGFTLNYDNQPAIVGNEIDYIFTSGFGWEID